MSAAEKQEEELPYITWDTSEIYAREVEHLQSEDYASDHDLEKPLTEAEAESQVQGDPWAYDNEWDYVIECLGELMKEMNPDEHGWHVNVEGFGWRNLDGWTEFETMDAGEFLRKILPDTECTFQIFKREDKEDGKTLYIRNWHHDSPMGESYYVRVQPEEVEEDE